MITINANVKRLVRSGLLLALAVVFQIIGKATLGIPEVSQYVVGPAINAILLISVHICGIWYGMAIGLLTPITALLLGQLPSPMTPFIPFIIIGNIIFEAVFFALKRFKRPGGIAGYALGAFLKYFFLSVSASSLVPLFKIGFPEKVYSKLIIMMGIPQLVTALIGGAAALVIIEILGKRVRLEDTYGKY